MNEGAPVCEVFGSIFWRCMSAGAKSDRRNATFVACDVGHLCCRSGELAEDGCGDGLCELCQGGADGLIEGSVETWKDVGVEPRVIELLATKRNEFPPLLAVFEHSSEELLALREVPVAMEQDETKRSIELGVRGVAELHESASSSTEIKGNGVFDRCPAASAARKKWERTGDVGTDGVDGVDIQASWLVEELPV
jgi:hypothetical protein